MSRSTRKGAALILTSVLVASAAPAPLSSVERGSFDPRNVRWKRLEFRATKLFLSATSIVTLKSVAAAEVAAEWIDSPQGAVVDPAGAAVLEVTVESSGIGGESTNRVWFNPRHADALQRLKIRPGGSKAYRKQVRFTDRGVFQLRTAPRDAAEGRRPHSKWKKIQRDFFPHPAGTDCVDVTEPSVLFYMLSARVSASQSICVFSDKQVVPISIRTVGWERLPVSYEERGASAGTRSGEVEVELIAVRPLASEGEFELLGLDGDIEIRLEKVSRVPVEVRGTISGVGGVRVRLTAVELGELEVAPAAYPGLM